MKRHGEFSLIQEGYNSILLPGFLVVVLLLFFMASLQVNAQDQDNTQSRKARIAVMNQSDFVPDRPDQKGMIQKGQTGIPDQLATRIVHYLSKSNRFTPVDRKALRRVVLEQRFSKDLDETYKEKTIKKAISEMKEIGMGKSTEVWNLSEMTDLIQDFKDLGSAVKADYLVVGDLDRLEKKVTEFDVPYTQKDREVKKEVVNAAVRLRVVDVEKGTVLGGIDINTQLSKQMVMKPSEGKGKYEMFKKLARKAASEIIDITFPLKIVRTNPLVLSRGKNNGVKPGMVYEIQRKGDPIKDEEIVIGHLKSKVGKVKVKRVQENISILDPIEGNDFQKNDLAVRSSSGENVSSETGKYNNKKEHQEKTSEETEGKPRVAVRLIKKGSTARTGSESDKHTTRFTDTILSRLTDTKRFRVLDRQEVDQLLDEQTAQALSEGKSLGGPLGKLSGADYLIYGNLSLFNVETKKVTLPGTNRTLSKNVGTVEGNMRIVNANSGQITVSEKVSVEKSLKRDRGRKALGVELADAYARKVVALLINELYQMKVAAVRNGKVYVNRGRDGGLSEGDSLNVMKPGEDITDPETGVKLGKSEEQIGTIVLKTVEDARSMARVKSGETPKRGYILKLAAKKSEKNSVDRNKKTGEAGIKDGKATIIVGKLDINRSGRLQSFGKQNRKKFVDELIVKLNGSNRFDVLDRQRLDQVLDQKTFNALVSGENPVEKLKELTEGEYIMNGHISHFYTKKEESDEPYTDRTVTKRTGVAKGTVQILDIRTGEVVDAGIASVELEFEEDDRTKNRVQLMEQFSTNWIHKVTKTLFPTKVIGITERGTLYVNRGSSTGLKEGTVYDLMRPGKELKGVESGTSFGRAEEKVGEVKIASVEESRARAKLVSGNSAKKGDVLRNPRSASQENQKEKGEDTQDHNW